MTFRNSGSASAILTAHVVGLGEPVLRVVGARARRELRQKRLERRSRLLVLARLDQVEGRLVVLLIAAGWARRDGGARCGRRAAAAGAPNDGADDGGGSNARGDVSSDCRRRSTSTYSSRWRPSLFSVSKRNVSISPRNAVVSLRSISSSLASCDQALVLDDALDANQARLEIRHTQGRRILGRTQRAAPACENRGRQTEMKTFHALVPLETSAAGNLPAARQQL